MRVRWGFWLAMAVVSFVGGCVAGGWATVTGFLAAYLLGMALAARRLNRIETQPTLVFQVVDGYAQQKDPVN